MAFPPLAENGAGTGRSGAQSLPSGKPWLFGLAGLALAALLALAAYLYYARSLTPSGFPLDDGWIHLQIARNLATGQGWSFNPGAPTGASTAPLWVALITPLFRLPGDVTLWVKFLGGLLLVANVMLLASLVRRITGDLRAALLAGLLAAWTVPYLWGALSGMEVHLSLLLALLTLRAVVAAPGQGRGGWAATTWAALALWARPEFLALLLPVWGYLWWRRRADGAARTVQSELRFWAPHLLIVAASVLAYLAFNTAVAGQPLPATWHAKVAYIEGNQPLGLASRLVTAVNVLLLSTGVVAGSQNLLLVMTLALGGAACWRAGGERRAGMVLLAAAVVVCLLAAGAAGLGGVGFQNFRRAAYLIACMNGLSAIGAVSAWELLRSNARAAPAARAWLQRLTPWLLLALVLLVQAADVRRGAVLYANDVRSINQGDVDAGRWVAANTSPGALIAVNDIGAIAYFGRRPVLDLVGLASPQAADVLANSAPGSAERERSMRQLLLAEGARYVIIFPEWFPYLSKDPALTEVTRFQVPRATSLADDKVVVYKVMGQ